MGWFEGDVTGAVSAAQSQRCLFIVFASDNESASLAMDEVWQDSSVSALTKDCIALKVMGGSDVYSHFTQMYPVSELPTTYLINPLNGGRLAVIPGAASPEDLVQQLQSARQALSEAPAAMAASTASASTAAASTASSAAASAAPSQESSAASAAVASPSLSPSASTSAAQLTKEERIARAQEVIAAKRQQRLEQEKEKQITDEKSRREAGKQLQQYKIEQEKKKAAKNAQDWKRERQEDMKAKEEVRQKILRDKAERQRSKDGDASSASASDVTSDARPSALPSDVARIQFRMPDGSSVTEDFSCTSQLSVARQFVAGHVEGRWPSGFILQTMYPRQELTMEVDDQTLQELGLAPRSALLVLPKTSKRQGGRGSGGGVASSVSSAPSGIWKLIMIPILLLQAIWQWLTTSAATSEASSSPPTTAAAAGAAPSSSPSSQPMPQASADAAQARQRKRDAGASSTFGVSKEGKVNRFKPDDSRDDDDMGTWNGNSTQQQ